MPYCTPDDVAEEFKQIEFGKVGFVTIDKVNAFITEADAIINSFVGKRYVVPITNDSSSVALMRVYSRVIVRDRVRAILQVKQQGGNTAANSDVRGVEFSTRDVMAALRQIQTSAVSLSGATTLVTGGAFDSFNVDHSIGPVFHKNQRQW